MEIDLIGTQNMEINIKVIIIKEIHLTKEILKKIIQWIKKIDFNLLL